MKNTVFTGKLSLGAWLWLLFCAFMTALWASEVWSVLSEPEEYASLWGAEGPVANVWYYGSEYLYLLHLAGLIVWFLSGIWLCLCRWSVRRTLLFAHFCVSMLWLAAACITTCLEDGQYAF